MDLVIKGYLITPNLEAILHQLELEAHISFGKIKKTPNSLMVCCPIHKEKNPSCGIVKTAEDPELIFGQYNCLACGAKGSLVNFVAACFECSVGEAERWLIDRFGVKESGELLAIALKPISLKKEKEETYLDESILDKMQSWHPYMDKRRLSKKVCEAFKVKYEPKTESLVFPVWDDRGRLVMLTRRSVLNKTFIIDANKEKPLYLLNYIKKNNIKEVTLVESQINCLTLWSYGIPSIASFGCNITPKQLSLLNKSGIRHLYVCYDGDDAGRKGTKKVLESVSKSILVDVIEMIEGEDVNSITEEKFNSLPIVERSIWLKTH